MGLFAKTFQFVLLPLLAAKDAVSKPTSRTLNERLTWAVKGNATTAAQRALAKGANANVDCSLLLAAEKGNTALVKSLLEHGAKVDQYYSRTLTNHWSHTMTDGYALTFAAREGHTDTVRTLLEFKADPWVVQETTITRHGGKAVVAKSDVLALAKTKCYDDITQMIEQARLNNPKAGTAPPAAPAPVAAQQPAAPDFNATAAPNVTTDGDIVVSGPLKLKSSAPTQQ